MQRVGLLCIALSLLALAGCKGGRTLEGKWVSADNDKVNLTLTRDAFTMEGPSPIGTITVDGTYTTDKDKINFTGKGLKVKAKDPKMQAMVDKQIGNAQQQMFKGLESENPETLTWVKDDEIKLEARNGKSTTFDRVKS